MSDPSARPGASLWLVGAGPMAQAYARCLAALGDPFEVIGRGAASAEAFREATGVEARTGGLEAALDGGGAPEAAIVALPVDALAASVSQLIDAGVTRVLVEKPAGLDPDETDALAARAQERGAAVWVAYNRRFYASTQKAREMIAADGGPATLRMEFSEFSSRIAEAPTPAHIKAAWLYANSTHVLDLGFYLAGFPTEMACRTEGALDWHPAGARFVGHGVTERGALFSYHADWAAAPRWMVEVTTPKRTLILQPLEALKYREPSGFAETEVTLEDARDTEFKPGVYGQTEAFLRGASAVSGLLPLADHARHMREAYKRIRDGG